MNFRSDNTATCALEVMASIAAANAASALSYGEDALSKELDARFGALFERDVRVFPVVSGTAANAIALASCAPPWGAVFCHREAHIERDELGAPEFYSGGAKLMLLDGAMAKLEAATVAAAIQANTRDEHCVTPAAVSISQTSERGGVYGPEEVAAIGRATHAAGLALHMDGARFANAVAALKCKPADVTWRAGVDLLSFGATKNGAMGAEAIICFDHAYATEIAIRRKRGGHLVSKSRFVAAQLLAYIEDDLWLRLARRANRLASQIAEAAGERLSHRVESNQVFVRVGEAGLAAMRAAGADFYEWGEPGSGEARLVIAWNQNEADVVAMCRLLGTLR